MTHTPLHGVTTQKTTIHITTRRQNPEQYTASQPRRPRHGSESFPNVHFCGDVNAHYNIQKQAGSCEHNNEPLGSVKSEEFLD